ncbi:hypothetical protein OROHE_013708 [Orobanche hederae]
MCLHLLFKTLPSPFYSQSFSFSFQHMLLLLQLLLQQMKHWLFSNGNPVW